MNISQQEAERLTAMEKFCVSDKQYIYPAGGGYLNIPLTSGDRRETFVLDIARSKIRLEKNTYQERAKKSIVLIRVDIQGAPHRNPDDTEILCPHIHKYREGFADKWAYQLPIELYEYVNDTGIFLNKFMDFCKIIKKPIFKEDLFI